VSFKIVSGNDATHENIGHLPAGLAAGYTTGTDNIRWTEADWIAHPSALRFCQDAEATDNTADILDVERFAATPAVAADWSKAATASFEEVKRPGQRRPAIYMSGSNVTAVVNALLAGQVRSGVGLIVANWNLTDAQAVDEITTAAGPFPIEGIQFRNMGLYDADVFNAEWVGDVSKIQDSTKPTRHIAAGMVSLKSVANGRGADLSEVIWLTATHRPGGFGIDERRYFRAGDMSARMPMGMVYWLPA
jgi:hypothetical protein